ncbi:hypothetical protein RHMOL_Rhmol10G0203700 [Rhododendron molle]|uniref:Uncharacterized protein n=1 Tax=Rhododendron molle TaxID=49168 RepID=A0ACC0M4W9_RHOML|nr:hypothetical protein RHMOL_Rhmol10G0203700 [Rhododendron molle]
MNHLDHLVDLLAGARQLKVALETMTNQLVKNPDFITAMVTEKRDFMRVQQNTPIPVEEDPCFPMMFPILYAFREFFGALPLMENLEVGVKEEVDGDKDANEVTKEEYLLSEENPEEKETPKAEDTN